MDEGQTQTMTVLGILAVGALLAAIYIEPGEEEEEEGVEDLAEVEPADLNQLTLVTDEGTLVAEHSDEGWRLVQPVSGAADDAALDDLVFLVDRLSAEAPLEGQSLEEFGLKPPQATLTLLLKDSTSLKLRVGDQTPVGFKAYIQWGEEEHARIAKGQPGSTVGLPFARYRDRGVLSLVETAVLTIAWEAGENSWIASRGEAGGWFLSDGRRAKASVLDGMLQEANLLEYEGFHQELTDMEAGLITPMGMLSFDELTLTIGGEYAGGTILRNPEGLVGSVGRSDGLIKEPGEVLEDRLLAVPLSGLDRVSASPAGSAELVWERTADTWTLDGEPDPLAGQTPFSLVSAALCDRSVQPEALGDPWVTLTARSLTDEVTVVIGSETEGGRVARDEAGGPLFLVPTDTVSNLQAALNL